MSSAAQLAASFDAIRERLFALSRNPAAGNGALVVSLMSRVDGEGVTTIAVGLARAIRRTHTLRTLLIDYDASRQGVAACLGVESRVYAGCAQQAGAQSVTDCVVVVEHGQLDVLTLDASVPSGFAADAMWRQSFLLLRSSYDVVLVDAGSTRQPLALRWARMADLRLLVLDTGRTTAEELERLKVEWRATDRALDAVILNKRDYHVPGLLYRYVR